MTVVGVFWVLASLAIILVYKLLTCVNGLPQIFEDIFLFGKLKNKRTAWPIVQLLEIPKRSFIYFYFVGTLINGSFTLLAIYCHYFSIAYPRLLNIAHGTLIGNVLLLQSDAFIPIILGCLMTIQNIRRFYESYAISIYSQSTINVFHFLIGIILYATFPLIIMSGAPNPDLYNEPTVNLKYSHIVGIGLFLWSSYSQHKAHVALAKLRLNLSGKLKSLDHFIPAGGQFEFVSCPHYLMEILIYISFIVVHSFSNTTLICLAIFVSTNQVISALMTHKWYISNFDNYPKERKALIPFIL